MRSGLRHKLGTAGLPLFAAGISISFLVMAFVTPKYVRVSPGAFDILRFGWVAPNVPRFERWNLATSRVLIGYRAGMIRLWDESKPAHRGLRIRCSFAFITKDRMERTILQAARTNVPTPSLPMDALTG